MGLGDHLLVVAVGTLTGTPCRVETLPRWGTALHRPNEARVVFETHAVRVAQDTKAVRAMSPLVGRTWQAADVLPALSLIVVAIGVAQTATGGIGRAVVIIAPLAQRLRVEMLVAPVVVKDRDAAMVAQPA